MLSVFLSLWWSWPPEWVREIQPPDYLGPPVVVP